MPFAEGAADPARATIARGQVAGRMLSISGSQEATV